jgi:hypothetical protein
MAQRYVTTEGELIIPGAYPSITVQKPNSGLATSGVIFLIGEADAGPAWSQEADLSVNFFAPTELDSVVAKYKSGNLVDAFRAAANPAKDPDLTGSPSFIYLIKSNVPTKASAVLARSGLAAYGTIADTSYGQLGNLLNVSVSQTIAESAPTTGSFTYIPAPNSGGLSATFGIRVNGGAKTSITISASESPITLQTALAAVSNILATGGVDRGVMTGIGAAVTLALAINGSNSVTITLGTGSWTTSPSVGDTLVIPDAVSFGATTASVLKGATSANLGAYVVTGVTSNTITATKMRDQFGTGVTPPEAVTAVAIGAEPLDIICYSPLSITNMSGTDRGLLTGLTGKTVTGTATASSLKLTLQTGSVWNALPQVGDIVKIPSSAPAAILASGANTGWYTVTAATSGTSAGASTITMTRLSNGTPASFVATAIAATTDIQCLRPAIDGLGKALAIFDDGGTLNVNTMFFTTAGAAVNWLSTAAVPYLLTSASEQQVTLTVNRSADGTSDSITAGGDVVLTVGYKGTTASITVGTSTITSAVTGGTGAALPAIKLSDFTRLSDLATFINSQTGWTCAVGSALYGQLSPAILDEGTYNCATDLGSRPARIKRDAADFFKKLTSGTAAVQLGVTPAAAAAGLPEVQAVTFLSGGTKGATLAANITSIFSACEKLRGNFVVPLFSRDATADAADGLTDASSDYTIDAWHAGLSSHVLAMSKLKRRRHRQGFASYKGTFADAKLKAQSVANYRVAMTCQDFKMLASDGTIKQFQPWMGAVLAAGMQAAGFYRSILFKGINCSGVLMADGSMTDQSDADLEAAITNGLLVAQRPDSGGFRWNSDQTTYAADDSFVYNSMQMIYAGDILALTTASRMERAFVGQSIADVSANIALAYLQGVMSDMRRLKLIAPSDDAPLGYKDAKISISGNAMKVSVEIKLAGAIVFIPINFFVTQIQQSAAA